MSERRERLLPESQDRLVDLAVQEFATAAERGDDQLADHWVGLALIFAGVKTHRQVER